ncbi:hypothetical protein DFQ28_005631 [Apophysomyces sp. BC1034]|nr:hypothetical protein DFQ29_005968 [Apophysomyces sp. BC1021]KAG0187951.1 hypothetical protein DFQ28_005631 [Apophysomyces sp. BC1034]
MWAPFSLLGEYISKVESDYQPVQQDEHYDSGTNRPEMSSKLSLAAGKAGIGTEGGIYQLIERVDSVADGMDNGIEMQTKPIEHHVEQGSSSAINHTVFDNNTDRNREEESSAGILLGIHNMYLVLPQFMVTFFSSVLFYFLEKRNTSDDTDSTSPAAIGIVLRVGAVMAGIAGYLSMRIGRES